MFSYQGSCRSFQATACIDYHSALLLSRTFSIRFRHRFLLPAIFQMPFCRLPVVPPPRLRSAGSQKFSSVISDRCYLITMGRNCQHFSCFLFISDNSHIFTVSNRKKLRSALSDYSSLCIPQNHLSVLHIFFFSHNIMNPEYASSRERFYHLFQHDILLSCFGCYNNCNTSDKGAVMKIDRLIGILSLLLQKETETIPHWPGSSKCHPAQSAGILKPSAGQAFPL